MAFPNSLELKFSKINSFQDRTELTCNLYRVSDGGIVDGVQQYVRVLVATRDFTVDAGELKEVIVAKMRQRLAELNIQYALGYTSDRFICDL